MGRLCHNAPPSAQSCLVHIGQQVVVASAHDLPRVYSPFCATAPTMALSKDCEKQTSEPLLKAEMTPFDIAVVGTGPVGLTAALVLAETGLRVALVGPGSQPTERHEDRRTAALFAGSIELLRNLNVWDACAEESAPLNALRILDGRKALLRAPEVIFHAKDVNRTEFGFNVPNRTLTNALWPAVKTTDRNLTLIETDAVTSVDLSNRAGVLHLADGSTVEAELLVGADGRRSICRTGAGITTQSWTYPQTAVTCTFDHDRKHHGVSTEFHHTAGPLTVVPLPGNASSLVWVTSPQHAKSLLALEDTAFTKLLETELNGLLGDIGSISKRAAFPLSTLTAEQFAANGVALVGEAAHVIPPIGAQGLNLGLRDCAVLADCIAQAIQQERPITAKKTLASYDRARRFDIHSRTNAVDVFNRSLLSAFLPAHLARGAGLHILKNIAPLRRWVVQEGLTPTGVAPNLMRVGGRDLFKARLNERSGTSASSRTPAPPSPVS